ncbi:MAG: DUF5717 family protein [Clostridiales bacterium]|jgi:hypothetical protein|nr:DUF5717 family protein [Clostridiales bacterium]MDR2751675.1 DUF5717 family protein [Clostridiales bacterium]
MEISRSLEHPLPILSVGTGRIESFSGASFRQAISISNRGGGVLEGDAFCNSRLVSIVPPSFAGNSASLEARADLSSLSPGESLKTSIFIVTTGGEVEIPLILTYETYIMLGDRKIASVTDLSNCARDRFTETALFFRKPEFRAFLLRLEPDLLGVYDMFASDHEPAFSLESFLRTVAGKAPPVLEAQAKSLSLPLGPFQKDPIELKVPVKLSGWGRLDDWTKIEGGDGWLSVPISASRALAGADAGNVAILAEPSRILAKRAYASVWLARNPEAKVTVEAARLPIFKAYASKESYAPDQEGTLFIENFTGTDILAEIMPDESFLRFDARRYPVGKRAEIQFSVRLTAMQALALRRQMMIETYVGVRVISKGEARIQRITVGIAEWE